MVALNEIVRPTNAPPPASANATAATSRKFSLTIFLLRAPSKKFKKGKGNFCSVPPSILRAEWLGYQRSPD
ncbi:hypothetical protein COU01_04295, partial [Candidatus Falkowbacteria bacterium CG10_big_fil_rev_8_21_14_0_10_44_15]